MGVPTYSYLSASIGFRRITFMAGKKPKPIPTAKQNKGPIAEPVRNFVFVSHTMFERGDRDGDQIEED